MALYLVKRKKDYSIATTNPFLTAYNGKINPMAFNKLAILNAMGIKPRLFTKDQAVEFIKEAKKKESRSKKGIKYYYKYEKS